MTRAQAEDVVAGLLVQNWTPESLLAAGQGNVKTVLRPHGFWRTRCGQTCPDCRQLTEERTSETRAEARESHDVGEYMANSDAVFVLGDRSVNPNDEKPRKFLDE